ncbi:hypothetical protein [cf. Phormidesmis sp. LEGE 11477]|uniref:hypothetical protein n=1 Tax=cf. Phormidesmis sp. LEGE 11477 TaxID=1828680 RepID=UPI00187E8CDF|nr:hypothetical protein [cf. Phormidesmis sp. LEGE 11477]MBE9063128.1 hypothetical protein [cf. Phormidesmis sp. LEGE 11477]
MILRTVTSLRKMTRQIAIALVGAFLSVFLCIGLAPAIAQAAPLVGAVDTLGAEAVSPDALSPEELSEKRAERRQVQSQASAEANTKGQEESAADRLNLDEMVEDNVLLGNEPEPTTDAANMPSR